MLFDYFCKRYAHVTKNIMKRLTSLLFAICIMTAAMAVPAKP